MSERKELIPIWAPFQIQTLLSVYVGPGVTYGHVACDSSKELLCGDLVEVREPNAKDMPQDVRDRLPVFITQKGEALCRAILTCPIPECIWINREGEIILIDSE